MSCDFWKDVRSAKSECAIDPIIVILGGYDVSAYPGGATLRQGTYPNPSWPNAVLHKWSSTYYSFELFAAAAIDLQGGWESGTGTPIHHWFSDASQSMFMNGLIVDRHISNIWNSWTSEGSTGVSLDSYGYGINIYTGQYISYAGTPNASLDIVIKDSSGNTIYHSLIQFVKGAPVISVPVNHWYVTCTITNIVNKLFLNVAPTEYAATGVTVI